MNKEALIAGHETKKAILTDVIEKSIHKKKPDTLTDNQWSMQRKIGFQYAFTDKTFNDLGVQYGKLTADDIRQLNHKFWDNLYKIAPELQDQYPRETIPDRKPLTQKSRERYSEAGGGRSLRIKKAIEELGIAAVGVKDIDDIVRVAKVTRQQFLASRPVLENWGIYTHKYRFGTSYADFTQTTRNENDDEKLQEVLNSFSDPSLIYFLYRDFNRETLTTASAIANEQGFHAHTKRVRFIAQTIEEAGIPIRQTVRFRKNGKILGSYYIVYSKHTDRIAEVLRKDPNLQRFR